MSPAALLVQQEAQLLQLMLQTAIDRIQRPYFMGSDSRILLQVVDLVIAVVIGTAFTAVVKVRL